MNGKTPKAQGFRQSQAGLHTWTGLLVGWILYLIFLSGAVSYWREEITRWTQPEIGATHDVETVARGAIAHLQTVAPKAASWSIALPDERASGATATFREKARPAPRRGVDPNAVTIGPDGKVVQPRDTEGGDVFYRLHFDLRYVPVIWGRWVAGFCAMFMLVAIVSGVITHKKIFADFFTFRPGKGQRSWLDGHNALAVLALPFHAMITYTGLVTLMVLYVPWGVAANYPSKTAYYAQSITRAKPVKPTGEAAALADIGAVLKTAERAWEGGHAGLIRIDAPNDVAARITLTRRASDTLVDGRWEIVFEGVTGQIRSQVAPSSSGMIARGGMIGLHAGRFAPMTLRWLFFLSGLAGTAMVATGLVLWIAKRRQKLADPSRPHFGFRLVERLNIGAIAGLPAAMAVFLWANRLLPTGMAGRGDWEVHVMFIAWSGLLLHGFARPPRRGWIEQLALTAVLLAGLPAFNLVATQRGIVSSLMAGDMSMAVMDLVLLGLGAAFAAMAFGVARHRPAVPKVRTPRPAPTAPNAAQPMAARQPEEVEA
ncbi:PepSY-associated TM helix domain-containing protein [Caulobacter endophyticus]|uniref:PepSY domain-containing protein n=1 Tax=Caulobacter endophyticus TaxID=2172652 RepID=A0A2T9JEP5_9CAUL|nr:PepSY-associated TM helix domain-containing protein [Caulobacter endophyticus]PVM82148.1 PepSY domain-containing protein [Caulobacter endophyticus]